MNPTTAGTTAGKSKLPDRVRHALRVRHLARSTEDAYVYWIGRFILHREKRHPHGCLGQSEASPQPL